METQEELIKEVFAQFGAAYYHSEVLHRGLCCVYGLATFDKAEDITRPRIEERMVLAFSLTLGQIVEKTKDLLPSDLQQRLDLALDKRNYLAHRFWYERCTLMFSEQGLRELHQELLELTVLFSDLDEAITEWFRPQCQAMGVTDEVIQASLEKLIAGEPDQPLMSQRSPKKQERMVRVWDVKVGDNGIAQIFETEDGCLWQFCDVGLGWTHFERTAPDWSINEKLQRYLPANINPRPTTTKPWNYEFRLAKGAVLWVKQGKRERSYAWGVKVPSKS
jgi:hypothetical protein